MCTGLAFGLIAVVTAVETHLFRAEGIIINQPIETAKVDALNAKGYELLKKLGEGLFGVVYLAKDITKPLMTNIAIKEISEDCSDKFGCASKSFFDEQAANPFECEVEILRLLNNLAADPFSINENKYIPMKYFDGVPASLLLFSKYRSFSNLEYSRKIEEFKEFTRMLYKFASDSLDNLHLQGILHGDPHINNFLARMVNVSGGEQIEGNWIDFGRAKLDYHKHLNSTASSDKCFCRLTVYMKHDEHEKLRNGFLFVLGNIGVLKSKYWDLEL